MRHPEQTTLAAKPSIEKERLLSLINFVQQAARLNKTAVSRVEQHGLFKLHEYELSDLPGVTLNLGDDDAELWMSIKRLQETKPLRITDATLFPWVSTVNNPTVEPTLHKSLLGEALIEAGTHNSTEDIYRLGQEKKLSSIQRNPLNSMNTNKPLRYASPLNYT